MQLFQPQDKLWDLIRLSNEGVVSRHEDNEFLIVFQNSLVSFDSINDDVSVNLITHDKQIITCYESEDLTWLFL